jgi:hypothetical protein
MSGEPIERMISDWGKLHYPNGPTWYGRPATEGPPLEIKMIPAFVDIEYNISNGGWAQFLWNCFPHWREIIDIAREGYLLIGASEQSAALTELWTLCERDEGECREMMEQPTWLFGEFTSRGYSAPAASWERLFWDNALYEKRSAWLAANEARLRAAMGLD